MSFRLPLRFEGSKGEKNLYALFDSGATYSCINEEIVEELEYTYSTAYAYEDDYRKRFYIYGNKIQGSAGFLS